MIAPWFVVKHSGKPFLIKVGRYFVTVSEYHIGKPKTARIVIKGQWTSIITMRPSDLTHFLVESSIKTKVDFKPYPAMYLHMDHLACEHQDLENAIEMAKQQKGI